jgi:hypothetical protein
VPPMRSSQDLFGSISVAVLREPAPVDALWRPVVNGYTSIGFARGGQPAATKWNRSSRMIGQPTRLDLRRRPR